MSHITRCRLKVEIKDKKTLEEVLKEMGEVLYNTKVYALDGQSAEVDIALKEKIGIGFKYNPSTKQYEFVGEIYDNYGNYHKIPLKEKIEIGFKYNPSTKQYEFVGEMHDNYHKIIHIQKRYVEKTITNVLRRRGFTVRETQKALVGVKV